MNYMDVFIKATVQVPGIMWLAIKDGQESDILSA